MLHVQAVFRGPRMSVGYIVYTDAGGDALIVDAPPGSTSSFLEVANQYSLTVKYLVNTHGHWDLIADNVALLKATGAILCAHAWDSARLANPSIGVEDVTEKVPPIKPSRAEKYLSDGDILDVGALHFRIMATPGHTPGSISVYEPSMHALFSGDTVGKGFIGNTDFPGGNPQNLARTLLKLAELPDNTRVFPAHGLATTIGEVRWLLELATVG